MKLIKLGTLLIAVLLISNVLLANTAVDDSVTVKTLSAEIATQQTENTLLKQVMAERGSLTNLTSRVESLGFVANPKVVTLGGDASLAQR